MEGNVLYILLCARLDETPTYLPHLVLWVLNIDIGGQALVEQSKQAATAYIYPVRPPLPGGFHPHSFSTPTSFDNGHMSRVFCMHHGRGKTSSRILRYRRQRFKQG